MANCPVEFALVPLESVKNGGSFDRRLMLEGNRVAIASPFGVICAILRQKINEGEIGKYAWIGQVHSSDVGRILSDIASKVASKSSSPRQVIEAIMGDSAAQFRQSLRVPDWTLLYFKLQSRIPDQAWQTLVSLTKLGRTGVSYNLSRVNNQTPF